MNNQTAIHIGLAFDLNFLTPFYVLVASVLDSNPDNRIRFHLIASGIGEEEKESITRYIQGSGNDVMFYLLREADLNRVVMPKVEQRYTIANLYRLYFPFLLNADVTRLLYMDTDILVIGDLLPLYNTALNDNIFAVVVDPTKDARPELGITTENAYFNSGVMLIDLPSWNKARISEHALEYINTYPERCVYVDQCALNAVTIGKWMTLEKKFNLMGQYVPDLLKKDYPAYLADKVIIHFNIRKPWDRLCRMRLKYLYSSYFKLSPQKNKKFFKKFPFSVLNIARLGRNSIIGYYKDFFSAGNITIDNS